MTLTLEKTETLELMPLYEQGQEVLAQGLTLKSIKPLLTAIPVLKHFFDEEHASSMKLKLGEEVYRQELSNLLNMLADIFQNADTPEELAATISQFIAKLNNRFDENMAAIMSQTKETRQMLHSVQLAYENAPKGTIQLFPIDKNAFVGCADDSYWVAFKAKMRKRFRKFDLKNAQAPCYFSIPYAIESPDAARTIAEFMEETLGLGILSIRFFKKFAPLINYLEQVFQIKNSESSLGHLAIMGVTGYKNTVTENYVSANKVHQEKPRLLPLFLGPAMLGRLLATPIGATPSGWLNKGLLGINKVAIEYDQETVDSPTLEKHGVIMVLDNGKIMATTTANNGDLPEYTSFANMDVFINVLRSLLAFSNQYAHGNWGRSERESFINQIIKYCNGLYDNSGDNQVIEEAVTKDSLGIFYNEQTKTVFVSIPIKYKGVVSKFRFTLIGKNGVFDKMKKRKI